MTAKPLTVVQVLPALESGGVEQGTLEVATELVRCGHRSIVISGGGRLVNTLAKAGSEHIRWSLGRKSPTSLRWVRPLRRLLRERQVDIVHARSRLPAWLAYLAWRSMNPDTRPRFITTVHGLHSVNRYSAIMTRGEAVIAISATVRDYLSQHYPELDASRIRLIYRGVDEHDFPHDYQPARDWLDAWDRRYPGRRARKLLVLPGRLTRRKGHEDFLQLLAVLKARRYPVHGLIVGGEDPAHRGYVEELRRQVVVLNLENHIDFIGHRNDMREIYAIADLVLSLSSKPEAFGRTVLEALCLGVPVAGYCHGGVGEILTRMLPEGRLPFGQYGAMADHVAALLDRPMRRLIGPNPFPRSRMLAETLTLYQELAENRCQII